MAHLSKGKLGRQADQIIQTYRLSGCQNIVVNCKKVAYSMFF